MYFSGMFGRGCVMTWMKERDALIAQTKAFVQSVAGGRPEIAPASNGSSSAWMKPGTGSPTEAFRTELGALTKARTAQKASQ